MLTSKPPFFLPAHDSLLAKEHHEPFGLSVHSTTGMLRPRYTQRKNRTTEALPVYSRKQKLKQKPYYSGTAEV